MTESTQHSTAQHPGKRHKPEPSIESSSSSLLANLSLSLLLCSCLQGRGGETAKAMARPMAFISVLHRRISDCGSMQSESKFVAKSTLQCMHKVPGNVGEETQKHMPSKILHLFSKIGNIPVVKEELNVFCRLKLPFLYDSFHREYLVQVLFLHKFSARVFAPCYGIS